MAYENPENGRIYLTMKMAPICKAIKDGYYMCHECPVRKVGETYGYKNLNACDEICMLYGDEIAKAMGYKKIKYADNSL